MLGVLLLVYLVGREGLEPRVPPPPLLPVLVQVDGYPVREDEFLGKLLFGAGPLFDWDPAVDASAIHFLTADPEVLKELAAWAAATRPSQRLEVRFNRYLYDDVIRHERRAVGALTIEGQNVRVESRPAEVRPDMTNSARQTRNGYPLRVVADDGSVLTWNGTTLEVRSDPSTSAIRIAAPLPCQTKSPFVHAPVKWLEMLEPFQEFQAAERAKNFKVTFGSQNKPGTQVHLVMAGRSRKWLKDFSTVEVILRAKTYEPMAIRWFDPAGTKETVYVYSDIRRD